MARFGVVTGKPSGLAVPNYLPKGQLFYCKKSLN